MYLVADEFGSSTAKGYVENDLKNNHLIMETTSYAWCEATQKKDINVVF